jgi:CHASE2 domain-containing sensor protein
MNLLPPWFSTTLLFLGILLFAVGFSLRRKGFGIFLLGLGVLCMLSLISYRIFLALQA